MHNPNPYYFRLLGGNQHIMEYIKGFMKLIRQKLLLWLSHRLHSRYELGYTPQVSGVQFGNLRRVEPISRDWGYDRSLPIDRYYIEAFLYRCTADIRGRVQEIGDDSYTRRFGGNRVVTSDVLYVVEGNPKATIVADLACADHAPSDTFDCVILTQTLQFIYDVKAALKTIHRILKSGGVLLATFPGISQIYDCEWGDRWYWNFTTLSARRLFEDIFLAENIRIRSFGNVLSALPIAA